MILVGERPLSLMVTFAIALHLLWGALILTDPAALNATGLSILRISGLSPDGIAAVILVTAGCAAVGMLTRRPLLVWLLLPQQILLMMSATGAVEAMWLSQFADGVVRSRAFIVADQSWSILAAIGHTIAITCHALRVMR